ncbi:hypothetical protein N0V90_000447 [Kalmusia sp. IMI 367209]|nr:hypothetical protein N0V90_000447 [Kalmusia sp. IMI 367209]
MQSYNLNHADTSITITGQQDVSFRFPPGDRLLQRIDRSYIPSEYWIWGSPHLEKFNFSLVVQGGDDGFACFVQGNNQIWYPPEYTTGYTDGEHTLDAHMQEYVTDYPMAGFAEYLVLHGEMLSPKLLSHMKANANSSSTMIEFKGGVQMPAEHAIYGPSTNDLVLSDYMTASGLKFPTHVQTVYNTSQNLNAPLEEFVIQNVTVNPRFPPSFFDGLPANQSDSPKARPNKVPGLSDWHLTEFSSNMLWAGGFEEDFLRVENPVPALPKVHWLILDDNSLGVRQLVIEFEKEVIVGDAPPQYSKSVIEWIRRTLKKPITHLWPTHHHRDHTGGAPLYVELGAKLIVPDISASYWSTIPNANLVTFNDTHPFVHKTSTLQAWFMWEPQAAHAIDFTYAVVTFACPTATSPVIAFQADIWHPATGDERTSMQEARQWLDQTNTAGLTADTM